MSEEKLVRGIGRWDLTAIAINTIIGAGIFGLPSKVHALIGSYSLWAFIACAFIIGIVVICYAEVSSRFTATGGPYLYAKEAFGPVVGFEVGWLYWLVRVTSFAANCNLFVTYVGFFTPLSDNSTIRMGIIAAIVILLTVVNLIGVRQSAQATNFFTVGKLLPLFVFAIAGLFFIEPANFTFGDPPGYDAFSAAVLLLIYAFLGFENAVIPAGETKDPQKSVPFAIIVGLAVVAFVYILIQVVAIGTLPGLAQSERPLADAASNFLGIYGAAFITIGALVSILGNLNTSLLGSTRLLFAMGEQRELPAILASTHPKYRTPFFSTLFTAVVVLVLTIYSSFLSALAIATITRLLVYATTCLALPIFRRRKDMPAPGFRAPLGVLASVLSVGLILWLLAFVDLRKEALPVLITAAAGLALYFGYKLTSRSAKASD